jgi:hypothetical protein
MLHILSFSLNLPLLFYLLRLVNWGGKGRVGANVLKTWGRVD